MILTKEEFQKSFMYIAPDVDIEPMLRFSNLTDTFVYVNLYLDEDEMKADLEKRLKKCRDGLKLLEYGRAFTDNDLDIDKSWFAKEGQNPSWMTPKEKKEYMASFAGALKRPEWGREIFLERIIGSVKRKLRLLFFTAEGLASYIAMSHLGKYPPKFVCTVQTNIMEVPGGLFEKALANHEKKPLVWVRGFKPDIYAFGTRIEDNEALKEKGNFKHKVQSHPRWLGYDMTERHVASFSSKAEPFLNVATSKEFVFGTRKLKLERKPIAASELDSFDLVFLSKKVAEKLLEGKKNDKVILWEDVEWGKSFIRYDLKGILGNVNDKFFKNVSGILQKSSAKKILMTPIGFEDEGIYFKEWMASEVFGAPDYLEVRFTDPLDYVDLMNKERLVFNRKNSIIDIETTKQGSE